MTLTVHNFCQLNFEPWIRFPFPTIWTPLPTSNVLVICHCSMHVAIVSAVIEYPCRMNMDFLS